MPAAVTALMMPFTYPIANGLAFGFHHLRRHQSFDRRVREVHWMVWVIAAVFLFVLLRRGTDTMLPRCTPTARRGAAA